MPKKLIQDIIVKNKNISSFSKKINVSSVPADEEKGRENRFDLLIKKNYEENYNIGQNWEPKKEKVSKSSLYFLWTLGFALLITFIFLLSSVFARASVTITPKNTDINLSDSYPINTGANVAGLHFEVMTIEKNMSKSLETDGEENVERKAEGKVTLYNNYSDKTQRLINNTRLQTKDGLIYRIRQSVDVPGIKNGTPGSVTVDVIADEAGDKYNMKMADLKGDFTIPGFDGSPKFDKFYGRISSDITGGYIGNVKKVSTDKISSGRDALKNDLKTELIKEAYSQMPDGFIMFGSNYYMEMNDSPDVSGTKDYTISENGIIHAIIFDKNELASFLAKDKINGYDGSRVNLMWDANNLTSEISGQTQKPWNESSLKVKLTGKVKIVWVFDANQILADIAGQNKSIIPSIIDKYKISIIGIDAKITPMWIKTFPQNTAKIKVVNSITDNS